MKTDSLFYRLFKSQPAILFELIEEMPSAIEQYKFSSVEIKETAFRIDGVLLPQQKQTEEPIYFLEVQF